LKSHRMIVCAAVLAAALLLGACGAPAEKGETFRLNHTSLELEIGQKSALELLNGDETVTEGILWFSSNSSFATVDGGIVTAVASGNCVITANYADESYSCTVTVAAQPVYSLSAETLEVPAGETATLRLLEDGKEVSGRVAWVSSDPTVASVKEGIVTAKKEGKASVSASYQGERYTCEVTVVAPEYVTITNAAEEISFDGPNTDRKDIWRTITAEENQMFLLQYEVKNGSSVAFFSSDGNVAEIDAAGTVRTKGAGAAILRAECEERGPNGEVYDDAVIVVVRGKGNAARTESVFQAPVGETENDFLRLDLFGNGTFSYYAIEKDSLETYSTGAGVYVETQDAVRLCYPENGAIGYMDLKPSGNGFVSGDIPVNGHVCELTFAPCGVIGEYNCRLDVAAMDEVFEFDLTLREDGSYEYFRHASDVMEEGLVNSGSWKISDGILELTYDGGTMRFQILCEGCLKSVGNLPTGGMETQMTFISINGA